MLEGSLGSWRSSRCYGRGLNGFLCTLRYPYSWLNLLGEGFPHKRLAGDYFWGDVIHCLIIREHRRPEMDTTTVVDGS